MPGARSERLALTYDNTALTDGIGAQLHRIYAIYSLSRLLGVSYVHTPIGHVDNQGLRAMQHNARDAAFEAEFNALCQIPSDPLPGQRFRVVKLRNISADIFLQLVVAANAPGAGELPLLAQILLPFGITDRFPDGYEICKQISPFKRGRERRLRVALHVRRGELLVHYSDRMLPNSYYISVARKVARVLDALNVDYCIELHTEVVEGDFTVAPGQLGASSPTTITAAMSRLDEFSVLPNLVHCLNERTADCLRKLATADVLVLSRSSFSYVAAILNRGGVVLHHPFWHPPLSSWLVVDPEQRFDEARLRQGVEAVLAGR